MACKIPVTQVYNEILDYYVATNYMDLIRDDLVDSEIETDVPAMSENEALLLCEAPYRIFASEDQKETSVETLRRYLTTHFSYLMRYVLCVDPKRFKKGNSSFIYDTDYTIIKEILLRSISENDRDLIVGKWLKGKIPSDSYYEIVDLFNRLTELIHDTDSPSDVQKRWITAFSLVLHPDRAYAYVTMNDALNSFFSHSLPFTPDLDSRNPESLPFSSLDSLNVSEEQYAANIGERMRGLSALDPGSLLKVLLSYIDSVDFEELRRDDSFPPVKLLQLRSVCECLYNNRWLQEYMPKADQIDAFMDYFISIDRSWAEKQKHRKDKDKQRYEDNKKP